MGSGGSSFEAPYSLAASVPAGNVHFILDAVITASVDVTFDWIWRHGDASADTVLAEWSAHYDALGAGSFHAQPFEYDEQCDAIDYQTGDQIVFRYTGSNSTSQEAYIPNGDGATEDGRIPNMTLPN